MANRALPPPINGYTFKGALEYRRYNDLSPADKLAYIQFARTYELNNGEPGRSGIGVWNAWQASGPVLAASVAGPRPGRGGIGRGRGRGRGRRGGGRGGTGGVVPAIPPAAIPPAVIPPAAIPPPNPPPDPKAYQWSREEFEQWKDIHACEKLAYVRWANEQKSDGTKTRQHGGTLMEEWKSFDEATRVGILEEYQSRDWQPYSLSGNPEAEFDIEDREEPDVAISPTASEDSFILPDTAHAEIARELKDPYSEVDHEWRFVRTLYKRAPLKDPELYRKESGYGTRSSLYMSFDEAETAQERIVAKSIEWEKDLEKKGRDRFERANMNIFNLQPNHYLLKPRGLVRTEWRRGSTLRACLVVFMDYCPSGTLDEILESYANGNTQIPEPFIWLVFLNIAESLHILHTGLLYDATTEAIREEPGWNTILHRDLKPGNVFLNVGRVPYPFYPNPQLADFEYCVEIGEKGWNKRDVGTEFWQAPESLHAANNDGTEKLLPSAKTDIFVLGLIIWELSHAFLDQKVLNDQAEKTEEAAKESSGCARPVDSDIDGVYSTHLARLQQKCLEIDPTDRPDSRELVTDIRKYMKKWEDANGLYASAEDLSDVDDRWDLLFIRDSEYPLGRKYNFKRRRGADDDAVRAEDDDGLGSEDSRGKGKEKVVKKAKRSSDPGPDL